MPSAKIVLKDSGTGRFLETNREIRDLSEYISVVTNLVLPENPNSWYRGISSHTFSLIPKLYRGKFNKLPKFAEEDLIGDFTRKAKAIHKGPVYNYSHWEWYCLMQHYGVPTRLLDWSENPLVALYFAIDNDKSSSAPCVWVLDPFGLNNLSADQRVVFFSDPSGQTEEDREIIDRYKFDVEALPRFPLAILPPYIDNRLQIQMGCFTIHGRVKNGLYNMSKEADEYIMIKLKIRRKGVPEIRKQLLACGISKSYLFPGLESLAEELTPDLLKNFL
ncbi:MAG: FRG domain-containing protein, partial [Nitrospinae bacterium]|nr:FRG domain-containing protein [Nitrospinota bacterium]